MRSAASSAPSCSTTSRTTKPLKHSAAKRSTCGRTSRYSAACWNSAKLASPIEIVGLADLLGAHKEIEAIGGVAYLAGLTDGVPRRLSIEQHIRIVKDKALLRGIVRACNDGAARAMEQCDEPAEVLNGLEQDIFDLSDARVGRGFATVPEIVRDSFGGIEQFYQSGSSVGGLRTRYADFDEKTNGLQPSHLVIIAGRPQWARRRSP
jgi:replicative DNA helicase